MCGTFRIVDVHESEDMKVILYRYFRYFSGPINFTMFLTLFGEKLNGTDPEDVIKNAFACFDERNTGKVTLQTKTLSEER